jgi:hypothetical protein
LDTFIEPFNQEIGERTRNGCSVSPHQSRSYY